MKLDMIKIYQEDNQAFFRFVAESQQDSALLMEMANRMPKSIQSRGMIDATNTWAYFVVPLKKQTHEETTFGNIE